MSDPDETIVVKKEDKRKQIMFIISFLLLLVVGLGNKIFQKLQSLPMHNYPYFLSLFVTFLYVPLSFAYIWPMMIWGKEITAEQRAIPWYKFAVMGVLDGIAGVLQTFAVNYIPSGSLLILLTQSAIPISMLISKLILKAKYGIHHYSGAAVVLAGLIVVLLPNFIEPEANTSDESNLVITIWCGVMIFSCVPMTLSSVYKEKALGEVEIDVIYMNGWIAVYQSITSVALAIPSAYASGLTISELPKNLLDGAKCYVGTDSILHATSSVPADQCHSAPLFVTSYLLFNVVYNVLIIMILKYGSSNILWLAMTLMVPFGNLAFALHFVPGHQPLTVWNDVGLVLIMGGLIVYRFFPQFRSLFSAKKELATINE